MSDGSLSQDEIDALLQGTGGMDFGGDADSGGAAEISDSERQAFLAVIKDTIGSQKSNFSMLVTRNASVEVIGAEVLARDGLLSRLSDQVVEISLDFSDGVEGRHLYLMDGESAIRVAAPMMGQEGIELDDAAVNALQEAFSQVSGPVVTTLGDKSGRTIMTDAPAGRVAGKQEVALPDGSFVAVLYKFIVEGDEPAQIIEIYDAAIVKTVAGKSQTATAPQSQPQPSPFGGESSGFGAVSGTQAAPQGAAMHGAAGGPAVQSVQFPNLQPQVTHTEQGNISLLMDVYMEMTVELGRTKKLIKEILGMGEGTIIELDKLAGEPVDILVNHKLIAKGEVVVIDENFGVRVTEIVSPMERVTNMT
ncbi:MAG: flagellar motor switch protein FliN [Spirochaetaceae bacterium]|nr:MAG: flagellar motor switch protein FliN [Spirochaetaceae bacterium]